MSVRPVLLLSLLLLAAPASAATMCHTAGAGTERLASATADAAAAFLEGTSHALLAVQALDRPQGGFAEHRDRAISRLEAAIADYGRALGFTEDLARADQFLKARAFDRLRVTFGVTPGSINFVRWEALARTARESATPAADFIRVCVAGAEAIKAGLAALDVRTPPSMARRTLYAWTLILSHGGLVADAFDASIR